MRKQWKQCQTLSFWAPKSLQVETAAMKLKETLTPWKESYDLPRQHIKKQRHHFVNKGPSSQCCGFSSGHVWMWELDYKESWALKNWCFWTMVLEKTLESPLDSWEIQPVHPKGNQSWVFTGRTDVEAETPILWPPHAKSWFIWKDPDVGKDWGKEEKGTKEDEMARWHHWLSGHEVEQTLEDSLEPGMLQSIGSQRVGHDWATELTEKENRGLKSQEGRDPSACHILVNSIL